jgi:EAL domain-containing protein (putative c-di-GMP-specific phosphodiesterase class I)
LTVLDDILAPGGLNPVFQPIMEIDLDKGARVHGLEALIRGPRGSNVESPQVLFEYARRKHEEGVVDRACVATILEAARVLPPDLRLSVNVHASTLGRDPQFVGFLSERAQACGIARPRLIVEIVEHAQPWDGPAFGKAVGALHEIGVQVALDDVGLGYSNYRMVLDCRPHYFKIDRHFVSGAHADGYRQAVLESIVFLTRRFGGMAVAEGIEHELDLATARALGIELAQGYFFSPPLAAEELGLFGEPPPEGVPGGPMGRKKGPASRAAGTTT